jgi:Xaa-Pro aminopeptidase
MKQKLPLPNSLDAFFISNPISIQYLTNFNGLAAPSERNAYLLIAASSWHLMSYQMYQQEMNQVQRIHPDIQLHIITADHPLKQLVLDIVKTKQIQRLGFEDSATYQEYLLLTG